MNDNQLYRPLQVKVASSLLLLYWAFGLVKVLVGHHSQRKRRKLIESLNRNSRPQDY